MDPLSCENAIYDEIKVVSSSEGFNIRENKCYGKVTANENKNERKKNHSYSKVAIMAFVIVFALLLGTAGACVAFALQITTLKSEIATLQMAYSFQNTFTDTLEEVVYKLNSSHNMLYQQLSQQNASIDSVYQQLRQEYTVLDQLNTSTQLLFSYDLERLSGQFPFYPVDTCAALPPSSPSGYYWVRASNGSAVSVYCDVTRTCGGITGGWMRVAELDMTNSNHQCPSGLMERIYSPNIRTCVRIESTSGCSFANYYNPPGVQYSHVCGRVIGYQYGAPEAFGNGETVIKYVDGVSITHGDPRQHIWTFAAAFDEVGTFLPPTVPASMQTSQPRPHFLLHLWGMTTSVIQAVKNVPSLCFTVTTLCGMGLGVGL